jgi:hypothetical protein
MGKSAKNRVRNGESGNRGAGDTEKILWPN